MTAASSAGLEARRWFRRPHLEAVEELEERLRRGSGGAVPPPGSQSCRAGCREVTTTNGLEQGGLPATAERGARSLDRVSAADLMLIWPEQEGWPQVIGALAVLEGGSMVDTAGEFRIDAIRDTVGHRLHLAPRFRQALY